MTYYDYLQKRVASRAMSITMIENTPPAEAEAWTYWLAREMYKEANEMNAVIEEADTLTSIGWCESCRMEFEGVCTHYEESRAAIEEESMAVLNQ